MDTFGEVVHDCDVRVLANDDLEDVCRDTVAQPAPNGLLLKLVQRMAARADRGGRPTCALHSSDAVTKAPGRDEPRAFVAGETPSSGSG
jgi:hypothetical protein